MHQKQDGLPTGRASIIFDQSRERQMADAEKFFFPNFYGDPVALENLKFFFLFCPNNSGTTVMSQYLSAQLHGYLPPFGHNEGQMAPSVKRLMRVRPWKTDQEFDWIHIRERWEELAGGKIFVEGSPPNLIKLHQIKPVFGRDSSALISICNPYQHVSSCLRRYSRHPTETAKKWIIKARSIIKVTKNYPSFPFVSYENFVKNPMSINEKLGLPVREVKIDGKHNSGVNGIASTYCRSVGFLSPEEIIATTEVLESASDVMKYFNYALAGPEMLDDAHQRDPDEYQIGTANREAWEQRKPATVLADS